MSRRVPSHPHMLAKSNTPAQSNAPAQSHDKDFKSEMGRIVQLQLWEDALVAACTSKRALAATAAARQQDVVNAKRVLEQFEAEVGLLALNEEL